VFLARVCTGGVGVVGASELFEVDEALDGRGVEDCLDCGWDVNDLVYFVVGVAFVARHWPVIGCVERGRGLTFKLTADAIHRTHQTLKVVPASF